KVLLKNPSLRRAAFYEQAAKDARLVWVLFEERTQLVEREAQLRRCASSVEGRLEAQRDEIDLLLARITGAELLKRPETSNNVVFDWRLELRFARMGRADGVNNLFAEDLSIFLDVAAKLISFEEETAGVARHTRNAGFHALVRTTRVGDYLRRPLV